MIQMRCPKCQSVLAFEDAWSGRSVTCPDCDAGFRVPSAADAPPPQQRDTVVVRLIGQGQGGLMKLPLTILVDNRRVGEGSVKRGFDLVVEMPEGKHTVQIGESSHDVEFPRPGYYEAEFPFSAMWGSFSATPKVRRVSASEAADWAAGTGGPPIELEAAEESGAALDQEVLAELEQLQNRKSGWGTAIALLVISLVLFMGAAGVDDVWDSVILLVPVLAFHEAGHYLAMLAFGYRNVRMFFIPFFGAAVSGQNYNVAGWKKAVVALAGPLPGIFLGSFLGVVGLIVEVPRLVDAASMMLILNGFNLLPLVPLDGGWIVHAVLFVRHPVLDLLFRIGAALCLLGVTILMQAWCLVAVGVFMLLAAPMAYRLARIAHRLGEEGLVTYSEDGQTIPREAALRILAELRRSMPPQTHAKVLAQQVVDVFETFNAEPPGVIVSFVLLGLHAGSFLLALIMGVVIMGIQHPPG